MKDNTEKAQRLVHRLARDFPREHPACPIGSDTRARRRDHHAAGSARSGAHEEARRRRRPRAGQGLSPARRADVRLPRFGASASGEGCAGAIRFPLLHPMHANRTAARLALAALMFGVLLLAAIGALGSAAKADQDDDAERVPSGAADIYSPIQRTFTPQAPLPGGPRRLVPARACPPTAGRCCFRI